MSEQNPTEKARPEQREGGGASDIPVLLPKCPHCGENVIGLNVSSIILPTPNNSQGDMTFLAPCCPLCNKMISAQFVGYTPREQTVGRPPSNLWKPGN